MNKILEYKGYRTMMEYDADDDILVGELIGLNDIVAFHGTTIEEFKMIFHRVVDDYIDYCKEIGKEPEKEYKGAFNVRITPELHKKIALKAKTDGDTLNAAVVRAITQYVAM